MAYTLRFCDRYNRPYLVVLTPQTALNEPTTIELTPGETPVTLEMDTSSDPFAPVRSTTGYLQAVAAGINNGVPVAYCATDTFVRLFQGNNTTAPVVWQGFLSPETYRLPLTARPHNIDLPLNGVLEAMDSVTLDPATSAPKTVMQIVFDILTATQQQAGIPEQLFEYLWISENMLSIFLNVYLDTSSFLQQHEYTNETRVTYQTETVSAKEMLSRICTFFGMTVSEWGTGLVFAYQGASPRVIRFQLDMNGTTYTINPLRLRAVIAPANHYLKEQPLAVFRGDGHSISAYQPARAVQVEASLKYDFPTTTFPDRPDVDLHDQFAPIRSFRRDDYSSRRLFTRPCFDRNAFSNILLFFGTRQCTFRRVPTRYQGDIYEYNVPHLTPAPTQYEISNNINNLIAYGMFAQDCPVYTGDTPVAHADFYYSIVHDDTNSYIRQFPFGAFFTRYSEAWTAEHGAVPTQDTWRGTSALYCCLVPCSLSEMQGYSGGDLPAPAVEPKVAICTITANAPVTCAGYILLQADMRYVWNSRIEYGSIDDDAGTFPDSDNSLGKTHPGALSFRLQVADRYWNGNDWQTEPCFFAALPDKNTLKSNWTNTMPIEQKAGLLIPVPDGLRGFPILSIGDIVYTRDSMFEHEAATQYAQFCSEILFRNLDLSFFPNNDTLGSDRTTNVYFSFTGIPAADTVSVHTDFASNLQNRPSVSLILMRDESHAIQPGEEQPLVPVSQVPYFTPNGEEGTLGRDIYARPEHDLLQRLKTLYTAPRRTIEIDYEAQQDGDSTTQAAFPAIGNNSIPFPAVRIGMERRLGMITSPAFVPMGYSWNPAAATITVTALNNGSVIPGSSGGMETN